MVSSYPATGSFRTVFIYSSAHWQKNYEQQKHKSDAGFSHVSFHDEAIALYTRRVYSLTPICLFPTFSTIRFLFLLLYRSIPNSTVYRLLLERHRENFRWTRNAQQRALLCDVNVVTMSSQPVHGLNRCCSIGTIALSDLKATLACQSAVPPQNLDCSVAAESLKINVSCCFMSTTLTRIPRSFFSMPFNSMWKWLA